MRLSYLSLKHDFQQDHTHIKIDETNNKFRFKHADWLATTEFPFRIDTNHPYWFFTDTSTRITTKTIPSGSYTKEQISKATKDIIEKEMSYVSWKYDDGDDGIGYNDFYNGNPNRRYVGTPSR